MQLTRIESPSAAFSAKIVARFGRNGDFAHHRDFFDGARRDMVSHGTMDYARVLDDTMEKIRTRDTFQLTDTVRLFDKDSAGSRFRPKIGEAVHRLIVPRHGQP